MAHDRTLRNHLRRTILGLAVISLFSLTLSIVDNRVLSAFYPEPSGALFVVDEFVILSVSLLCAYVALWLYDSVQS